MISRLRQQLFILPPLVVLALGLILFKPQPTKPPQSTPTIVAQQEVEQKIYFSDRMDIQKVEIKEGETVLSALQKTKLVEIKEYSFGKSVESIDTFKNGVDNKYWLFYVNGQQAPVGADQYQLKPGDKVEWRFEKGQ